MLPTISIWFKWISVKQRINCQASNLIWNGVIFYAVETRFLDRCNSIALPIFHFKPQFMRSNRWGNMQIYSLNVLSTMFSSNTWRSPFAGWQIESNSRKFTLNQSGFLCTNSNNARELMQKHMFLIWKLVRIYYDCDVGTFCANSLVQIFLLLAVEFITQQTIHR